MESDWPRRNKSHYVTEIVSWLGFAGVIFGGDKRQPEIRLRSQANILVVSPQIVSQTILGKKPNYQSASHLLVIYRSLPGFYRRQNSE